MSFQQRPSAVTRARASIRRFLQQAVGSLGELWRTPMATVMTVLVLGISLTLPATLHLFVKNAEKISAQWDSAAQITVFLKGSVKDASAQNLVKRLRLYPEVAQVTYISSEQAFKEFKQVSGLGQALDYLESNPLPATLLVTPTERSSGVQAAQELLAKILKEREVEQGKLDIEWLTRLQAIMELMQDIVFALAILLCLSVVLIIGNTIRLAIINQKQVIAVMKLVGATDSFIQRPFLFAGIWYGILGGLLALAVVSLLAMYLSGAMINLAELYQSRFSLEVLNFYESVWLILLSIILGLLGSYLSVRQHIRAIEPNTE